MIYYSIPYSTNRNIGAYYNSVMENLPNDTDFACFVDGDTIFTTSNFGDQIADVIKKYPDNRFFTCYTNRVGNKSQVYPFVEKDNNDIQYHRNLGKMMQEQYWNQCSELPSDNGALMSGFMILVRKDLWKEVGGFKNGMLSVDNDFHLKCIAINEPLLIMSGVYLYHWYRWPNYGNITHLKSDTTYTSPKHKNQNNNNKKVVYTCIYGKYDTLRNPKIVNPNWDYVCFTDQKFVSDIWDIRQIPNDCLVESEKKIQRKIKILPNRYLKEYDLSIWIDGNLELLVDPEYLVSESNHTFLTTLAHPQRVCLYDELDACDALNKDSHETLNILRQLLNKERYPKNNGLAQTNVMIRNHNDDGVSSICEQWWHLVKTYSHRDQTVFNYVLWKYPNLSKKINLFSARTLYEDFNFYTHGVGGLSKKKKDPGMSYGYLNNYVNGSLIFDGNKLLRTHNKDRKVRK